MSTVIAAYLTRIHARANIIIYSAGQELEPTTSFTKVYRFMRLSDSGSRWLVIAGQRASVPRNDEPFDLNEPVPGQDGRYQQFTSDSMTTVSEEDYYNQVYRVDELAYDIADIGEGRSIDLTVPYIPYNCMRSSLAYDAGLCYGEYVDLLKATISKDLRALLEYKVKLCNRGDTQPEEKHPTWSLSISSGERRSACSGFFNGIPVGPVSVHDTADLPFSLVSSAWRELKNFTIHKSLPELSPSLRSSAGEDIACRGYITSTWTEDGVLSRQWFGVCLFVVDCELRAGESEAPCDVMLSTDMLGEKNVRICER